MLHISQALNHTGRYRGGTKNLVIWRHLLWLSWYNTACFFQILTYWSFAAIFHSQSTPCNFRS